MDIINTIGSIIQIFFKTIIIIIKELFFLLKHVTLKTIDKIKMKDVLDIMIYQLLEMYKLIVIEFQRDIIVAIIITIICLFITLFVFRSIFWQKPRTLNDKKQQLRECEKDIWELINEKNCNPLMLRLAWSDAATYDRTIRKWPACGGANGYVRFKEIYSNPVNTGLSKAIALLAPIKAKYTYKSRSNGTDFMTEVVGEKSVSWADIIQMAGAVAVQHAGGPRVPILYGRVDATYSEQLIKQIRPELLMPCSNAPYCDGTGSAEVHVRNVFYNRMGFTNQEIVALCGGHTIGSMTGRALRTILVVIRERLTIPDRHVLLGYDGHSYLFIYIYIYLSNAVYIYIYISHWQCAFIYIYIITTSLTL